MKTFTITYKRENGSISTEEVQCRTVKLNKTITDYYLNINAEILNIEQL